MQIFDTTRQPAEDGKVIPRCMPDSRIVSRPPDGALRVLRRWPTPGPRASSRRADVPLGSPVTEVPQGRNDLLNESVGALVQTKMTAHELRTLV